MPYESLTQKDVLKMVKERDVKFIRLWFTDILGQLKSFAITDDELEGAFDEGMGFDGSSIKGFARIDESDMLARPDPVTFQLVPWRPKEKAVGRMFCDILNPEGSSYEGDPRYVLKRNLEKIREKGYTFYVGPELEYFYFKSDKNPETLDEGGYFDLTTLDAAGDLRRETVLTLEAMGIKVEYSHHEVAPSQHEIPNRCQGDSQQVRSLCYLHAQAHLRGKRERHAYPSIPFQGSEKRLFRSQGSVPAFHGSQGVHRGDPDACPGNYRGDQSVGELL
jgi:glutamine synthetase